MIANNFDGQLESAWVLEATIWNSNKADDGIRRGDEYYRHPKHHQIENFVRNFQKTGFESRLFEE